MVAGQDGGAVVRDVLDALHPGTEEQAQPRADEHVLHQPVEQEVPSAAVVGVARWAGPEWVRPIAAGQPIDPYPISATSNRVLVARPGVSR